MSFSSLDTYTETCFWISCATSTMFTPIILHDFEKSNALPMHQNLPQAMTCGMTTFVHSISHV